LNIIIPHFQAYPLLTSKSVTFTVWALAVSLFAQGAHKTTEGFMKILSIYAAIGRGASNNVLANFPTLIPYTLPVYNPTVTANTLNGWWMSGYCTIDCYFSCYVTAGFWKVNPYQKLRIQWSISANVAELLLIRVIADYLDARLYLRTSGQRVDINITSLEGALTLVNFFNNFPLQSNFKQPI